VNSRLLTARQTKYAAYAAVYILVVLGIVTVGNVLADRYNKSYDGTANKRYSLSEQTAKIVKGLKQDATITYYDQSTHFRQAKDLLDEYANLSHKVHIEYVDPDKKPQLARMAGVKNYGTAVVQIGAKHEEARSFDEDGITGAFIRDIKNNTRTVCFVTGSGEHQIDDTARNGYSRLKDLLGKDEYEAKSISLLEKAEVPGDCTVLVVGGPGSDYLQPEVDAIKKYVEGGGRALFMLDPPLSGGMRQGIASNDALDALLQSWGVTLDKDLILDLSPVGQLVGLGPQVALVTHYDSHPIVNEIKGMATGFPLSRSMDISNTDKTTVEKLFSSSGTSLATTNLSSPAVNVNDPKNKKGPMTLAAAGTYNTGSKSQGRFVVVGSSLWAANSFINFNGNSDLALDTVNWLSSDEDLISIRPKAPEDRRVTMTQAQMIWVRTTSQFLLPLLVVVGGVAVWWRRR
jgi:gliding motility-associatede transport system auxiliary component